MWASMKFLPFFFPSEWGKAAEQNEGNNDMRATTLHPHSPRTAAFYNERFEPQRPRRVQRSKEGSSCWVLLFFFCDSQEVAKFALNYFITLHAIEK